jgi:hypothetical protein
MGKRRYTAFYLAGGVAASLAQVAADPGSHAPTGPIPRARPQRSAGAVALASSAPVRPCAD